MTTKRIILLLCATTLFAIAGLTLGENRSPGIPWRSFYPVHYDELDLASQLLEENCYEPKFIVPRTTRPSVDDKTAETTVDFIIVGKRIDDCAPGDYGFGGLDFE